MQRAVVVVLLAVLASVSCAEDIPVTLRAPAPAGDPTFQSINYSTRSAFFLFSGAAGEYASEGMFLGQVTTGTQSHHVKMFDSSEAAGSAFSRVTTSVGGPTTTGEYLQHAVWHPQHELLIFANDDYIGIEDPDTRSASVSFSMIAAEATAEIKGLFCIGSQVGAVTHANTNTDIRVDVYDINTGGASPSVSFDDSHVVISRGSSVTFAGFHHDAAADRLYCMYYFINGTKTEYHLATIDVAAGNTPTLLTDQHLPDATPYEYAINRGYSLIHVAGGRVYTIWRYLFILSRSADHAAAEEEEEEVSSRGSFAEDWSVVSWPLDDATGTPERLDLDFAEPLNTITDFDIATTADGDVYLALVGQDIDYTNARLLFVSVDATGAMTLYSDQYVISDLAGGTVNVLLSQGIGPGPHSHVGVTKTGVTSFDVVTIAYPQRTSPDAKEPQPEPEAGLTALEIVGIAFAVIAVVAVAFGVVYGYKSKYQVTDRAKV